jgi:hypothetical protein
MKPPTTTKTSKTPTIAIANTMKTKLQYLLITLALLAGLRSATAQERPVESLTYQGRLLTAAGAPASGSYDLVFTLFNTNSSGVPVAGPITNTAVAVGSDGLFTTVLDFGANVFTSATANRLEIGVATNSNPAFTTLTPRQLLTPVAQSMHAGIADVAHSVSASTVVQG